MRVRPGIQVVPDLADVFAVRSKFEDLRRCSSIGGSTRVAAGINEDVLLRIDRDARSLAEIKVGWKFQQIRNGIEWNFGHRRFLSKHTRGEANQCNEENWFHGASF